MKKILTTIIVVLVIISMSAGYLLSMLDFSPKQNDASFQGPTGEPFVNGPPTSTAQQ
jgi:hypothetical protein